MYDKQSITINFEHGLDLKTDPFQIPVGKFQQLNNSIFDKTGRLTKRNGFGQLTSLPDGSSNFVTTLAGNLTAIGTDVKALASGPQAWVRVGGFQPVGVSVLPLIRNNNNQTQVDIAVSTNNLACIAYTDSVSSASSTVNQYKYAVYDYTTGQALVNPTIISPSFGTNKFAPRVFNLSPYFILVFDGTSGSTSHLQYFALSQATLNVTSSSTDITTSYAPQGGGTFDGIVANNVLYLSWNGASNSGIKATALTNQLTSYGTTIIASSTQVQTLNITADMSGSSPTIWTTFGIGSAGGNLLGNTVATGGVTSSGASLATLFSATNFVSGEKITNLAAFAFNNQATIYYEVSNNYGYDNSIATNLINFKTVTVASVTISSEQTFIRSLGLGSKAFVIGSQGFVFGAYSSTYQSGYYLLNSSASILARIAYGNGGGYYTSGLPQVLVSSNTAYVGYLFKDLVTAVNKNTAIGSTTQSAGIFSQTGINLGSFNFSPTLVSSEIAGSLHLSGGLLSQYDGTQIVEHNFNVFPENVEATTIGSGLGGIVAQTYFYAATYEWQDNKGNLHRSAPSIPVQLVVGSTGSTNTINVPTLRLTSKTLNPVKIVLYRWSTGQQNYYQVTTIAQPVLNSKLTDSVAITDVLNDNSIIGNSLLYTTGGVVEDDGPHPCSSITQFDSRLWTIDSEDGNLTRYSKQVLETTPVEMSDFFNIYISPNTGAQGSTGPMTCQFPMDDKNILFKKNAIYYINGTGPDNTGANLQYSQPIFVTGTVGCSNPSSLVLIPNGLMFQSDKGIWLLGRDLSTEYIGRGVEAFNSALVESAIVVPGTNQVRFTLNTGVTLMYDYFRDEWATFSGIPGVSSTLYQNLHSYIDKYGRVFQETPGQYLDGSNPTLLSFQTGWISLSGLQGYMRAYRIYLLGQYLTPHRLTMGIAYDYDSSIVQLATFIPQNYAAPWGNDSTWGTITTWGGSTTREQWQVGLKKQQCQAIQISLNEYYDSTVGASPGAGLTISGIKLAYGQKSQMPKNLGLAQKGG